MVYAGSVDNATRHFPKHSVNAAKRHVVALLQNMTSLRIAAATVPSSDLVIEGTIPVSIGASSYNIPVQITIPVQYPGVPPKMFVVPTSNMYISPSRHLDKHGTVFHPYLHSWNPNMSNIYEFVCVISAVFAREPPVYSKSNSTQSTGTSSYRTGQSNADRVNLRPSNDNVFHAPQTFKTDKVDEDEQIMEQIKRQSLMELLTQSAKRRIMEISEMEKLKRDHRTLTEGESLLEEVFVNLKRDEQRLIQSISTITEKITELDIAIAPMKKTCGELNIDEEVKATAPLYAQILRTVAEENAIQDTIYQLGRALNHDLIPLDEYLKYVRNLSRDQFMKRALIIKARKEAGLR